MKEFLIKYWIKFAFAAAGALGGFLYWNFIGCSTGTCPITSHWYTSCSYGILLGWLISDIIKPTKKDLPKKETE